MQYSTPQSGVQKIVSAALFAVGLLLSGCGADNIYKGTNVGTVVLPNPTQVPTVASQGSTSGSNTGSTSGSNTGSTSGSNTGSTSGSNTGSNNSGGNSAGTNSADPKLADFGGMTVLSLGTVYTMPSDGFVVVSGRLDGRGGQARVKVNVGNSVNGVLQMADWGHAMIYNNGSTYLGTAQLMVPVIKGQSFQILCDENATCGTGGYLGYASMYFQSMVSRSGDSVIGSAQGMSVGTLYGPAQTDGFVFVYGRLDGRGGLGQVSVATGSASQQSAIAYGYSHNDGANYLGSYQVMAPVQKGEYYRVLCEGQTSCPGPEFIGDPLIYFQPFGTAQKTAFKTRGGIAPGTIYTPPDDGILFHYARLDGEANVFRTSLVTAGPSASGPFNILQAWGGSYNYNPGGGVPASYLGNFQVKAPIPAGRSFRVLCDGLASCPSPSYFGNQLLYWLPTQL